MGVCFPWDSEYGAARNETDAYSPEKVDSPGCTGSKLYLPWFREHP